MSVYVRQKSQEKAPFFGIDNTIRSGPGERNLCWRNGEGRGRVALVCAGNVIHVVNYIANLPSSYIEHSSSSSLHSHDWLN